MVEDYRTRNSTHYGWGGSFYSGNCSDGEVSHSITRYRYPRVRCRRRETSNNGCEALEDYAVSLNSPNDMSPYEFDWQGHDFDSTIYLPAPEVSLSEDCESRYDGESTSWEDQPPTPEPDT